MTNTPEIAPTTSRWLINSTLSRFTVQAFAGGLLSSFGHSPVIEIPEFSGEVHLAQDIAQSSCTLTINASALQVATDMSDKDRLELERAMREKVLETDGYPEIVYQCSKVSASGSGSGPYWAVLNGQLTLHGITRALSISARVRVDESMLKVSGSCSILQSDYGIELVSVAGGALKVKDEVKLSFEIAARRED